MTLEDKQASIFAVRDLTPGAKFAAADLIGCPYRLVCSDKLGENMVEIKRRDSQESFVVKVDALDELRAFHDSLDFDKLDTMFDWDDYHQRCTKFMHELAEKYGK